MKIVVKYIKSEESLTCCDNMFFTEEQLKEITTV